MLINTKVIVCLGVVRGKQKWRKVEKRQIISLQLDNFAQSSPGMEITSWKGRKHRSVTTNQKTVKKLESIFFYYLCLCLCFNTNQLFFIPMLLWGIVPFVIPIGWGGGYMGIANQMILVQPFCSERWETAFLNYRVVFCLFVCFHCFLHNHSHIMFLCNS